jgi:hypothetical protein
MRANHTGVFNTGMALSLANQLCSCSLHPISELSDLLLVVIRRKCACRSKRNRHRRSPPCLHDARNCRSEKRDTVSEREFRSIILVLFDAIAYIFI